METLNRDIDNNYVDLNFIHWYRAIATGQLGTSDDKGTAQRVHKGPVGTNGHQWVQRVTHGCIGDTATWLTGVHIEMCINTPLYPLVPAGTQGASVEVLCKCLPIGRKQVLTEGRIQT